MKRILFISLFWILSIGLGAQTISANHPLPENPDTLRILAIGNSFSDDGTEYLPSLLEAAGIHNVIVARLYIGGCSLERHCKEYESGAKNYTYWKSEKNRWIRENGTDILRGLHDEPWDIITIQETSGQSGIYDNIKEWAPALMAIIRKECSNPDATIAWHQTWAYSTNSSHPDFPRYGKDQEKMHSAIQSCVDKASKDFDIPVVIPVGVAIREARTTSLNNKGKVPADCPVYDLTRDGYHLSRQYGRYIAACTWFEALIGPTLGISVKNNSYTLGDTEHAISAKEAAICRKCAVHAVKASRGGKQK